MARKNRTPEENARMETIRELLKMANIGSMEDIQSLVKEIIAEFMENGLEAELNDELGYSKYDYKNKDTDNGRKVRSVHRIRGNSGEPQGQPPYGYMKSPENKKKWVIEPEAAAVVQRIFQMALEGKGNETIAHALQTDKVTVPANIGRRTAFASRFPRGRMIPISGANPLFPRRRSEVHGDGNADPADAAGAG